MPIGVSRGKVNADQLLAHLDRLSARLDVMTRLYERIQRQKRSARTVKSENEVLARSVTGGAERTGAAARAAKVIRQSKHRVSPSVAFVSFRQPTIAEKKYAKTLAAKAKAALVKVRG